MDSDSTKNEITHDWDPFFRVYKDGHVERLADTPFMPPSDDDPKTGVRSKDVVVSTSPKVSARLYLPKTVTTHHRKLPLVLYIHGGAFSIESAFSTLYHTHLNSLVSQSDVVAVSIEYRLAPEHPIPACYDDSWATLNWVFGSSPDPWITDHADLNRVFLAGDSAGANIAHNMAIRAIGSGLKITGMALIHPFFGDDKPDKLWMYLCPVTSGCDDPRLNPCADPGLLAKMECKKVLVCTAGKDFLRKRGWSYYEALKKSEWNGSIEIVETEDEEHVFHLFNPDFEKAGSLIKTMAVFFNQTNYASSLL